MSAERLRQMIDRSDRIVFFGGAGTSTESGIPDFRSADGLYNTSDGGAYAPEEILSRDFFYRHPEEFYRFYKTRMLYPDAAPNAAHYALAELERQGRLKAVITQNIDGLHQKAGSRNVLELHGSVLRNYCIDCRELHTLAEVIGSAETVPKCRACGGIVKPDVVLYQESLDTDLLERAVRYIAQADMLIVAGTSLTVQPAAGLIRYYRGDRFVLLNRGETPADRWADVLIRGSIAEVFAGLGLGREE